MGILFSILVWLVEARDEVESGVAAVVVVVVQSRLVAVRVFLQLSGASGLLCSR